MRISLFIRDIADPQDKIFKISAPVQTMITEVSIRAPAYPCQITRIQPGPGIADKSKLEKPVKPGRDLPRRATAHIVAEGMLITGRREIKAVSKQWGERILH